MLIQNCGEIPSFKNTKKIVKMGGRYGLITDPRKRKIMDHVTNALEFQLRCLLQTTEIKTETECIPLSKIVSLMPLDDSVKWIENHCVGWRKVSKGQEGFEIEIEVMQ